MLSELFTVGYVLQGFCLQFQKSTQLNMNSDSYSLMGNRL